MTIDDHTSAMTNGRPHTHDGGDVPRAAVEAARDAVVHLLDRCAVAPSSLRVTAGPVTVELTWSAAEVIPVAVPGPVVAAATTGPVPPAAVPATPAADAVTAPAVGVFYRAPEPGARPFAEPGDVVVPGQQLGVVEAMKLLIPVESDRHGTVVEFVRDNGTAVEFGEPLVLVAPSGG